MRYSLRVALATLLTLTGIGTAFAQYSAETQFVPGTPAQVASPGFDSALVISSLTIYPGALLDLTNGGMVVDASKVTYYAPNGSGGYSQETGLKALNDALANMTGGNILNPPYGQPSALSANAIEGDGTSGITSSTVTTMPGVTGGLGMIPLSEAGYNTWRGVNLNSSVITSMADPVLVGYTYFGDLYLEGYADPADLSTVASNIEYGAGKSTTSWEDGDEYYEGYNDPSDLSTVAENIYMDPPSLYTVPSNAGTVVSPPPSSAISTVPEPGSAALLIAALISTAVLACRPVFIIPCSR